MRFREPVVVLAAVAGLVLAVLEFFDGSDEFHWRTFAAFLIPIVVGFLQRILVTPVADPRAPDGTPLVKSVLTTATPHRHGVKLPGDAGQASWVYLLAAVGLLVLLWIVVQHCAAEDDVDALRHVVAGLTWR